MSSLEDRNSAEIVSKPSSKTRIALESIAMEQRKQEAAGYAVMSGLSAFGEATEGTGWFARIVRGAKWFCIWFGMIVPVFLFWQVAFQ